MTLVFKGDVILVCAKSNKFKVRLYHWIFNAPPDRSSVARRHSAAGTSPPPTHLLINRHRHHHHHHRLPTTFPPEIEVSLPYKPQTGTALSYTYTHVHPHSTRRAARSVRLAIFCFIFETRVPFTWWDPGKQRTHSPTQRNSAECFRM